MGDPIMAGRDLFGGYTGVVEPQQTNPPQYGGFLQPTVSNRVTAKPDAMTQDFMTRSDAYDVLVARGRQDLADTDPQFEDVRLYRQTGQLPSMMGSSQPTQPAQPAQEQPKGLFVREDQQPQTSSEQTQQKPVWDYSNPQFAPIRVKDDADEKRLETEFNGLGEKWADAVDQAKKVQFTGKNLANKGDVQWLQQTNNLVPWMFKNIYGMTPDEIVKLPPATRREMISDMLDTYVNNLSQEDRERTGISNDDNFKAEIYKKYGVSADKDEDSTLGSAGTFLRGVGGGVITEAGKNPLAIIEAEFGDGDKNTGVGKAYKAADELHKWVTEDPENGQLTAAKMRLQTLLSQNRWPDAVSFALSDGELRNSLFGELAGAMAVDAAAYAGIGAAIGSVAPGLGNFVGGLAGGLIGGSKGLITFYKRMSALYEAAQQAKNVKRVVGAAKEGLAAGTMQAVQSAGVMYADLLDNDVAITPEVKELVHDNTFLNGLITMVVPGSLEHTTTKIAGALRSKLAQVGKTLPEETITSSAAAIAKQLSKKGVTAADGVIENATPWQRVKGGLAGVGGYVKNAIPEVVQEGATAYNEDATKMVNQDGTIRELTPEEQQNRVTNALFEGAIGGVATVPRSIINSNRERGETQRLKDAYQYQFAKEKVEADVAQQSDEFKTLYEQAEGTPEQRYQMAKDTLAAKASAEEAMARAAQREQDQQAREANDAQQDFAGRVGDLKVQFADEGLSDITPTYNPLHNYVDAGSADRTKLGRVISQLDNVLTEENEDHDEFETLYALREKLKRGDLSSISNIPLESDIFDGSKTGQLKKDVDSLSKLTRHEPVITEGDQGVTRFTAADRRKVADQLTDIVGDKTDVDPDDLTGSIFRLKNRLSFAQDGVAKQKGLEQLSVLERLVAKDLPEGVDGVAKFYRSNKNNSRFRDPVSDVFTNENGEALYNQSRTDVEGVITSLVKVGALNEKTGKAWKDDFNALYRKEPTVAISRLNQRIASVGNSLVNNEQANFLGPNRTTHTIKQHHFANALNSIRDIQNNVNNRVVTQTPQTDVNSRVFAQYGESSSQLQNDIGDMVDGIRSALSGKIVVPTNRALTTDPIGKLRALQEDLNGTSAIAARNNESVNEDIEQAKSYVNTTLDALLSGAPVPEPSDRVKYFAEQHRVQRQEGKSAVIEQPNNKHRTGQEYEPRPLNETTQGRSLLKAKTEADKVAEGFEVIDTANGPLVFMKDSGVDGNALANIANADEAINEHLEELVSMVRENTEHSVTTDTMDGGVTGKQDKNIQSDVATATAEEFNAGSFKTLVQETNENGDNIGLAKVVHRILNVRNHSGQVNWKSSLTQAIYNLLTGKNTTIIVKKPKIVMDNNLDGKLAYYKHTYDGGEIHINANMTTDANVTDAIMHELVHWAIAQRQLTYLQNESSTAVKAIQNFYMDANVEGNKIINAIDEALVDSKYENVHGELGQLREILKMGHDSNGLDVNKPHPSSNATAKNVNQQIAFEELVAFVEEQRAKGVLPEIDDALRSVVSAYDSLNNLSGSVADALMAPNLKPAKKGLFNNGRITYASRRKQPTIIRYGFKANNENVTGDPVAYIDPTTNSWTLYYVDKAGNPHLEDNLTFSQLTSVARGLDLWPGRIEKEHLIQKTPQKMMSNLQQLSPTVYKFASRINKLLGSQGDHDVRAPVRQITNFVLTQGVRQQGLTSWFSHIENAILNLHGEDVRDQLEAKYNDIRQRFQYEINENPITGEDNINAMQREINKLMRESGFPQEKIDNMLYALEAEGRHGRILKETPVDPLTGKRRKKTDNLTGFLKPGRDGTGVETDINGREVDDSDGSKYRATWTAEDQLFAKSLKQLFINLNNRVLELELAAGRMTEKQFKELYGKFYVPLRNEDDGATAFTKKVTGRSTKADSPMVHFRSNMYARLKSAEQSMIMQEVMDMLALNPVDGFMSFNSTTLTKNPEGKYIQRADGFIKGSTITFFRDGMKYTGVVDDPVLSRALKAQRDGAEKDAGGSGYMRYASGALSMLARARTLTPSFFITSIFRDGSTALVNHQAAFRGKSGLTALEHQALAIKTVAYATKNLPNMLRWKANPDKADWRYKVYRKYGGIGNSEQFDLDSVRSQVGQDIFDKRGFLSGAKTAGRKYQDIMHASDDLIRFATWLTFLEKKAGRKFTSEDDMRSFLVNNPEVASLATSGSKNITGNFQNKGIGNRFERSHFIFWNATMTGINNAFRMFNPRYGMQGIGAATTLFTLMFLQGIGAPDDDDDEKARLFKLKNLGDWIGVGGEGGFAWPLSQELRPVSHLAYALSGVMTRNLTVGQGFKMFSDGVLQGVTPFTPAQTSDETFNLLYPFAPTVVQPALLGFKDENFFGQPVRSKVYDTEGREITDAPDAIRFRNSDAPWAIEMAHAFYRATGGGIDVLPSSIEEVPKQMLGGFYSMFKNFSKEYEKTGDAINSVGATLAKGKQVEYNEFAIQENANRRFLELRQRFRVGDSTDDMMKPVSEQPEEYQTILAIEKETRERIKNLESDGESLSSINERIKKLRLDPTSPQELFELQSRAADIYAQRNYIYGEAMRALDELGLD